MEGGGAGPGSVPTPDRFLEAANPEAVAACTKLKMSGLTSMSELITQEETDRSVVPGVPGGLVMLHENFDYADEADQTISAAMHSDAAGHPREPPPHALNAADAARARARHRVGRDGRERRRRGGGRRGRGRRAGRRGGRGRRRRGRRAAAAHGRLARPARGALDPGRAQGGGARQLGRARRVPAHGRRPDGDEPPAPHGLVAAPPRDRLRAHLGPRRRDRGERPRRPRRDLPHAARARLRERLRDVREPAARGGCRPGHQEQARRVHALVGACLSGDAECCRLLSRPAPTCSRSPTTGA